MKTRLKTGTKYALLIILVISLIIPIIYALDFNAVQNQNVKEGSLLEFSISITNPNGTTNFTRTPNIGTLTKISNTEVKFSWTPNSGDAGIYTLQITAQDDSNIKTKNVTINVSENNPPQILSKSGGGLVNINRVKIGVVTDVSATCKYSLESKSYSAMEYTMNTLNAQKTEHEGMTPTLAQGNHIIYLLCKDSDGNFMINPETIIIESNQKPTATISLSPNPPLRGGTVAISLTSSEDLISAPKLEYMFSDDSRIIPVALEGSGRYWSGYMVIQNTETERVGNFIFKGYDLTNLEGTEITNGKIFLVDSGLPNAVQSISIANKNDRIELMWHYADAETDNIKEYNIYRKKTVGGVDYVDYYETTSKLYYYDDNVDYNEAYYYKISAVDEAENEGPLSKEVFITHTPNTEKITTTPTSQELDKSLQYVLDIELQKIDKIKLDIAQAEQNMGKVLGADNLEVIDTLGLLTEIKAASNKVDNLKNEMESLRNKPLTQSVFESEVGRINTEATLQWKKTPTGITIDDSTSYKEFVDDTKTEQIANNYIKEKYPEAKSPKNTIALTKKLQDLLVVDVTLIKAKISYPEENKLMSVVKKTIAVENSPSNLLLLEQIPEEVYGDLSKITFKQQPKIITNYNIVYWDFDSINKGKIVYSIPADINMADLKYVKTIIFSEPEEEKSNLITGLAPSETSSSGGANILFILIIAGIAIIFGLFAYYVFSNEEETEGEHKKMFLAPANLFKKRKVNQLRIIPDEHKKLDLTIEHKDRSTSGNIQVIKNEVNPLDEVKESSSFQHENLNELHNQLKDYKENLGQVKDIDEIDAMREKTLKIRALCDEIEEKNIQAYAQKTKEYLEKTLLYLNKNQNKKEDILVKETKPNLLTRKAPQGKSFKLSDGAEIRTLEELGHQLGIMNDSTFNYHVSENKNDFANWIRDVFEETELAHKIRSVKTKEEIKKIIFS